MKKEKANLITDKFIAKYFDIDKEEAILIYNRLERITYNNNEIIVSLGDSADGLYFIDEGQATVINDKGEPVNEMIAGQYFGEYAILADEKRMSTVRAHGRVIAYRMSPSDFLDVVGKHPKVVGRLLKQVYGQISSKHTKLISLTRKYRGVMSAPDTHKDTKPIDILITYGTTALVFIVTFIIARYINPGNALWQLLPLIFLMAFTLRTKRIVEGMLLTVILLSGMLWEGNFLTGFGEMLKEGIGNTDTASTIAIMAMVETVAALFASAGVASAFKKLANRHMKTKTGSMFGMLFIMVAVCIDECLNILTSGFCLNEAIDKHKVPRESRALLASFSMAICAMIPFSLWGAYVSGWIDSYIENGGNVFLKAIPFNMVGVVAIIASVLICIGLMPKSSTIKEAYGRIADGGKMWPSGSEEYYDYEMADDVVGKPVNLILPMIVWMVSSVFFGMINNPGEFAMDAISGLLMTLIVMFFLYIGQRIMSPKSFFETVAEGIGNSLMPILLLVFAERIAASLETLGFDALLEKVIMQMVHGQMWLVPGVLFLLCTIICFGLGSCWGMYGLGIPVTIYLATRFGISIPLCLGATFAAGIIGESLCLYLDDTSPAVTAIGCEPVVYRKVRMQYWGPILVICSICYLILGYIVC